jgi:threonine synthase
VRGSFDTALDLARALGGHDGGADGGGGVVLVNSVNPHRIAGQQTAAFEIVDTLGDAPHVLAIPVGNGGNITAYRAGFVRYADAGLARRTPRMIGAQAAGAAPFVSGAAVAAPETVATAIRIGRPATWQPAIDAARDSGGAFVAVPDAEILDAYRRVAMLEGVFCEPASAAGVAGLRAAVARGHVARDETCVCVLTGHGLKDPDRAISTAQLQATEIDASLAALRRALA